MEKHNVKDTRRFKSLEELMDYIPLYEGRPNRDRTIGQEDIIDLQITLHTTRTVEDFLKAV